MSSTRTLRPTGADGDDGMVATPDVGPTAQISEQEVDGYKEQDRFLPIANVGRVMKQCLPDSTKVSKDAKEIVQECTSEFISFITSEAAEHVSTENRKTINGEDILLAMQTLGFENYAQVLTIYLAKYREHQKTVGKRMRKSRTKASADNVYSNTPVVEEAYQHTNQESDYNDDFGEPELEEDEDDEERQEESLPDALDGTNQLGESPQAFSQHLFAAAAAHDLEEGSGLEQNQLGTGFEMDQETGGDGMTW
ncbi:hypothetical protein ACM66B_000195 [Microbotryomycetes sp. NB124-2]